MATVAMNTVLISDWYRNLNIDSRWNTVPVGFVEMDYPVAVYCHDGLYYARPLSRYAVTLPIVGTQQSVVTFHTCFAEFEIRATTEYQLVEPDPDTGVVHVVRTFQANTMAVGVFPGATFNLLTDCRVFNGSEVAATY